MVNVFKKEEIPKDKHVEYSETYQVNFWITIDGTISKKQEIYHTASKGRHKQVAAKWKKEYNNKAVTLISVIYE